MSQDDAIDVSRGRAEVRVLGPLRVRRADGQLVPAQEWRTAQTADLLRLLALHVDEPVPVDVLVRTLWPRVDDRRGRASLRTAASRIRTVLGEACVVRRLGGLVLTDVWVDAHAYSTLATEARRHVVTGDLAHAVTTAREAEALHLGSFRSHHDNADWALRERDTLEAVCRHLVADAADAAVSLSWWHDAVDLAERSLDGEPVSERAYRALMRAWRGLGETPRALQVYDRCRRTLAEELGSDPSPATQALYQELLADEPVVPPVPRFCGREHELQWLREVSREAAASGQPQVVLLRGTAGVGITRLLDEAWRGGPVPVMHLTATAGVDPWPGLAELVPADGRPAVLALDDAHLVGATGLDALALGLRQLRGPVTVVLAGRGAAYAGFVHALAEPVGRHLGARLSSMQLPPLAEEEVVELCEAVLQGAVSPQLTEAVLEATGGQPGAVVDVVRDWAGAGRVAATSEGLVVTRADGAGHPRPQVRQLLTRAVDRLTAPELDLLHVLAVLARPVPAELLLPLLARGDDRVASAEDDRRWLQSALDRLVDLSLVTAGHSGFAPRDALLADAALGWLRPSALRALHRRVAERADIPEAERVRHWGEAGEPQLAQVAAMDAAAEAVAEGRHEQARRHLRRLCRAQDMPDAEPADRMELFERLGDVCATLGRTREAADAYEAGAGLARDHGLAELSRLEGKRAAAHGGVFAEPAAASSSVGPGRPGPSSVLHAVPRPRAMESGAPGASGEPHAQAPAGRRTPLTPGPEIDERFLRAAVAADEGDDPDERACLRALLAWRVCVPRRQFRAARHWARESLSLTVDPQVCVQALVADAMPGALLGNGEAAETTLDRAFGLTASAAPPTAAWLAALRAVVAHDLGHPSFAGLLEEVRSLGVLAGEHAWLLVRTATERGNLAAAAQADRVPVPDGMPPVLRQLRSCASATLALAQGREDDARRLLLGVVDLARSTGATLLVPEAAARLVMLEAPHNLPLARRRFELFDWSVGSDTWLPRESVLRLLARAAVRSADGRPDDAAECAAAAADTAESTGLVRMAALAHRHRAACLAAAASSGRASQWAVPDAAWAP
ncbi:MAG TPA: BTAD domain-containing putative transcriptional regulator [Actinomycetales bacterium]|nr:BTAD domain-containing putative transcriptional regulator [Actinomycetales bacterium]